MPVADLRTVGGLGDTAPGATGLSGMLSVHGPDHARLRGAAAAWFAPARVEQWRPFIRQTCRELIGDPQPGTVIDLVETLCVPLPGPLTFDPARTDQRRSLVFGGGPHYCIGAGLAQVEIEEALRYLTARYPGLQAPGWMQSEVLMSLVSLPVRIPAERRA